MGNDDSDKFAERLHQRIDDTHKLINEVKISYAEQKQVMINLQDDIAKFCKKVDDTIYHPEDGHITKTKTKLSAICTQLKNQWYLITVLFGGLITILITIIKK